MVSKGRAVAGRQSGSSPGWSVPVSALWFCWLLPLFFLAGCGDGGPVLEAVASSDVSSGMAPLMVQFHGDYRGGESGGIYDFSWDFGDEVASTSRLRNPVHTFLEPDEYTVKLTVIERTGGDSAFTELSIQVGGKADLIADGLVFTPHQVTLRDSIAVSFQIINQGFLDAPPSSACLLVSETARLLPESTWQLGKTPVDGLEPGEKFLVEDWDVTVQGALRSRDYWVAVKADCDEEVDEASQSNNVDLASARLTVSSPHDAPDLLFEGIKFAPTTTLPSSLVRVELSLRNGGTKAARAFDWRLYLSPSEHLNMDTLDDSTSADGELDGDLILLLEGDLEGLPAETGMVLNKSFNVPEHLDAGRYFLIGVVDGADSVEEMDEANNVYVARSMLSVIDGRVDGVDILPTQIYAGEYQISVETNLHAFATICNRGIRAAGPFMVRFAFSEDGEWSDDVIPVGVVNLTRGLEAGLGACKDVSLIQPLLPSMGPGQYHLCVMADPVNAVPEANKDNNWACDSRRVAVGSSSQVDLAAEQVVFQPGTIRAGELLEVGFRVDNLGSDRSGGFEVGVFISEKQEFDGSIRLLETLQVSSLAGETGQDMTVSVSTPLDLDARVENYYVGVMVDPWNQVVGETNRENNLAWAPLFARIVGGMGGCRPDALEPNNTMGEAVRLSPGFYPDLGRCGDDDWYTVPLRAGYGLFAAIDFPPSKGALGLELYGSDGVTLIDRSLRPGVARETVLLPLATFDTVLYLRVTSLPLDVANMYDLEIAVMEPLQGVDLVAGSLVPESSRFSRGAPLVVNLPVTNMGTEGSGPFQVTFDLLPTGEGDGVQVERLSLTEGLDSMETTNLQAKIYAPPGTEPGLYRVRAVVDSGGLTGDVDYRNNISSTSVVQYLVPPDGCMDDIYDPNESWHTAKEISPGITEGLLVCQGFDDWFMVELEPGEQANVRAYFLHEDGDIDLELYGPDMPVLIGHSRSSDDRETLDFTSVNEGTYWIRVLLHSGPYPVNGYRLALNRLACEPDDSEPNDEPGAGTPLDGLGLTGRTICIDDVDYYRITLFDGVPVTIGARVVEYEHQSGLSLSLSLVLLAPAGEGEGEGEGEGDGGVDGGQDPDDNGEPGEEQNGEDGGGNNDGEGGEGGQAQQELVQVAWSTGEGPGGVLEFVPQRTGEYLLKVSQPEGLVLHYDLEVEGLDGIDLIVEGLVLEPETGLRPGGLVDVEYVVRNQRAGQVPPFFVRMGVWQGEPLAAGSNGGNGGDESGGGGPVLPDWDDSDLLILHQELFQNGLEPGQILSDRVRVAIPAGAGAGDLQVVVLAESLAGELNPEDNGAVAYLQVEPVCVDDQYEPNDFPDQAWPLGEGSYSLSVCYGIPDYFKVELPQCGDLQISIGFEHGEGDLDLVVLDQTGEVVLGFASSGTDWESVTLQGLESGTYLIGVLPFMGASNNYQLEIVLDAHGCDP